MSVNKDSDNLIINKTIMVNDNKSLYKLPY